MKNAKILATAAVIGALGTGLLGATTSAHGTGPKGVITASILNQTAGSQPIDANDVAGALVTQTGDTLKYTIEVRNEATSDGHNDLQNAKLTVNLPIGVELDGDASKHTITEDLGTIKPGDKATKEYMVRMSSTKDGQSLEGKACFTGDSEEKDSPQKGCDSAFAKVAAPKQDTPAAAVATPTAPQAPASSTAEQLPHTGASEFLAPLAALTSGAVAYVGRIISLKRRQS